MNALMNWKTTLTVIIGAVAYLVSTFGIVVTPETQNAIILTIVFFVGLFARDGGEPERR